MREKLESTQRDLEASRAIRSELATELANATTDRKLAEERLEGERVRADGLIKQIEEKEQALAKLTTENQKLESCLAEAAENEIFLSEELNRFKYGVSLADDEPSESPAVSLQPEKPEILEEQTVISNQSSVNSQGDVAGLVKRWRKNSKATRDWTKANQLLQELENLI